MDKEMGFGKMVLAAMVAVTMFIGAWFVTLPAFAEEEIHWSVWVIGFDFETAEVILEDEDGFLWSCPFGKSSWTLGDEYILVLSENGASIEE